MIYTYNTYTYVKVVERLIQTACMYICPAIRVLGTAGCE